MDVADGNQKRGGNDPNGQALVTEAKAVLEDLNCTQQCLLKNTAHNSGTNSLNLIQQTGIKQSRYQSIQHSEQPKGHTFESKTI